MLVPLVGALELVRRVGCIGHHRDTGHVRALSCISAPADAVDGQVACLPLDDGFLILKNVPLVDFVLNLSYTMHTICHISLIAYFVTFDSLIFDCLNGRARIAHLMLTRTGCFLFLASNPSAISKSNQELEMKQGMCRDRCVVVRVHSLVE
jgi:hypothetical protein